jgi:hypothetical protein
MSLRFGISSFMVTTNCPGMIDGRKWRAARENAIHIRVSTTLDCNGLMCSMQCLQLVIADIM